MKRLSKRFRHHSRQNSRQNSIHQIIQKISEYIYILIGIFGLAVAGAAVYTYADTWCGPEGLGQALTDWLLDTACWLAWWA